MSRKSQTTFAALAAAVALVVAAPAAQARHGADDRAVELRHGADDALRKQDDRVARRKAAQARRGADDRGGKRHGRGGRDDGPNHD